MTSVEKIAAALLYEGYVLWPYRRSAPKNRQRWTFGCVFPRVFSETSGTGDPWLMRTECLVRGQAPRVRARVRFLQVVERQAALRGAGGLQPVEEVTVDGQTYLTWEEAIERTVQLPELASGGECRVTHPFQLPAGRSEEVLGDGSACLVRTWEALEGRVEVHALPVGEALHRISLQIENLTPWSGSGRQETLRQALVSTHTLLTLDAGEAVSLTDPEPELRAAAAECRNLHTWPVLVGEPGERHTLLSAPIILPDYPQIAPESLGDMFDGTEIDQLLLLTVLTLSDAEKREMRASDPRTREILERAESLTAEDLNRLHGTIRDFQILRPSGPDPFPEIFSPAEKPAPDSIRVGEAEVRKGSRVRLKPGSRRDLMDGILNGRVAVVDAVEQDYEDRVHLAVVLEDDPGRDLGPARIGHRYFFAPDEVEPLECEP